MKDQLSLEFSRIINSWFTAGELAEINTKNSTDEYINGGFCATQDMSDANMAMDEAFTGVMGRDIDLQSDNDVTLWNNAWQLSKDNKFSI